ncbi:DUF4163 domain-containing protein [Porphyrobacter sp. YT40]|uniref:DUF4163 domain-containing protein n=1 Tax=Porphyrobacter sp. YT40 TaxID=2547601 RepID=UPI001142A72A|nr:DUF4163 domain-containing protein [Porphyrobacter sp. YT40]QDH35625.1 DUF4163 domain-containing protein [Porphyrobacter sp. YT40]
MRVSTRVGNAMMAAPAAAALWLAACAAPDEAADTSAAQSATPEPAAASATPAAPAAKAVAFTDNAEQGEAKREFAYSWPAEVSAIPALATRFTEERDRLLGEQKADWEESLREFGGSDCVACVNRGADKSWAVVADLPRFLSLSAEIYAYTGGAHGNSGSAALVWDRETGTGLESRDFFTSPKALQDALGAAWCKGLVAARRRKMGADAPVDDGMFPCPPIADLTVLLGSKGKTHFDRIGLIADPYVAGSYAEGAYEVTLPVTPAVLAAVKPEYKAAFALAK